MIDPRKIPKEQRHEMEAQIMKRYGLKGYEPYSEQEAAWHLLPPEKRPDGLADTSTLKRNRRKGLVPFTPYGNGAVRYWGIQLADYLLFGKMAVLLWGGELPDDDDVGGGAPTPPPRPGGGGWAGANTQPKPTSSGPTGSDNAENPPPGIGAGQKPDAQSVFRLAQQATKRPSSG